MLELLLPQRCLVCFLPGGQVCSRCTSALRHIRPPWCERCGAPTAWPVRRCAECAGRRLAFAHARAAVEYDEPVRRIVASWKERGLRRLADWAADVVVETLARPDTSWVSYVPGDPERRLWRGHHAPERLAAALADRWGLTLQPLLVRVRGSPRQRGLTRADRRRNVATAFEPDAPIPSTVTLIDDVYTTGATANAAAAALKRGGAKRVEIVTFARTIRLR